MTTAVESLLSRLAAAGIQLRLEEGDRLRYRAPKGALTPELAAEIKTHREALVTFLATSPTAPTAPIPRLPDAPHYAVSQAQWRLWVLMQMERDATAYNVPLHLEFRGALQPGLVERVFAALVMRHEALRTNFLTLDGEPRQVIHADHRIAMPVRDVSSAPDPEAAARELAQAQTAAPFDLERDPLLRLALVRLATDRHVLLLTLHHIIADGTSFGILLREFGQLYAAWSAGEPSPLTPLRWHYRDFTAWQNARWHDPALADQGAYWRSKLGGELPVLELPLDHQRPPVQTHAGREYSFAWDARTTAQLTTFCQQGGATVFMGLVALIKLLLHRYTGQTDFIIGSPIAGRTHPDVQDQVGYYLNTLALRTTVVPDATIDTLLAHVRATVASAFDHQDYPFDFLINELGLKRDLSRSPLFDVLVVLQNQDESGTPIPGLDVRSFIQPSNTSKLDLTFYFKVRGDTLHGAIEYNPDLFDDDRVARMADHLRTCVGQLANAATLTVASVPLLTPSELRQVASDFNRTDAPIETVRTVVDFIDEQVARQPGAPAIRFAGTTTTYAELAARADELAAVLRAHGAAPGQLVGVCLERSPDLVAALLAVMRTGAAYVPLDPGFPAERLVYMLDDADAKLLIARPVTAAGLTAPGRVLIDPKRTTLRADIVTPPATRPRPDDLAYVLHTSGSTGRPKGVAVRHRGLTNFLQSMQREPGLAATDRLLAVTTVSFDIAGLELWLPLLTGATIVLADRATAVNGARLLEMLTHERITFLQATPATWRLLLDAGWSPGQTPDLVMACGGEAMPGALARELLPRGRALWNLYGPTETTIWSTLHQVTADDALDSIVTIGRPIANTRCLVLDAQRQPAPLGVPGELYIGGEGVARGYWRRPELTAEFFTPEPGANNPSTRCYRTGDLVRWRADGTLEFFGRHDHQVKLRGYRIELGEIEAGLASHASVRVAAVVVRADELVAYVEPESTAPEVGVWRDHLRQSLPDYMIPSRWIVLDALPLTANGKIDRRALPDPTTVDAAAPAETVAPRTPMEAALAAIWREVLDRPIIGVTESFFDLGGHSLKAARVVARIRREMNVDISIADVFTHPTIAGLALQCAVSGVEASVPTELAATNATTLSIAQRRLWILEQMRPGTAAYHMADTWWLDGAPDLTRFQSALATIHQRHEALRTTFRAEGDAIIAQVHSETDFSVAIHSADAPTDTDATAIRLVEAAAQKPFDLSQGPLIRAAVVRRAADRHLVLFVTHHIVSDGWSLDLIMQEFAALYNGVAPDALPLVTPYRHYAATRSAELAGPRGRQWQAFWRDQLGDGHEALALPTDFKRPAIMGSVGRVAVIHFEPATFSALQQVARSAGATDFMALVALVKTLLHRYTGQTDLKVGTPVAGRDQLEWEHTVGFFINTVVLRDTVDPAADVNTLLAQVRETCVASFARQAYPFDQLVDDLKLERDLGRNPLFDVAIQHAPRAESIPALNGLNVSRHLPHDVPLKCDLSFDFGEDASGLVCGLTYNPELFSAERIARLGRHLRTLAAAMFARPTTALAELPLLDEAERTQVLQTFARPVSLAASRVSLSQWFAKTAADHVGEPAIITPRQTLTFHELHDRVESLAGQLIAAGIGPGEVVGAMLGRDPHLPIALLAILRIGAIYLPLDPALPAARIEYLVTDGRVRLVISTPELADQCPSRIDRLMVSAANEIAAPVSAPHPQPADPAYLVYTSGSTGQPKGVLVSHGAFANTATNHRLLGFAPGERTLQFANPSFDASILEILGTLLAGAALVYGPPEVLMDPVALPRFMREQRVTFAILPPSFLHSLDRAELPLRMLVTAGEAAVPEDLQHYAQHITAINAYGPTEAAVCSTIEFVEADPAHPDPAGVPIGRPLDGTELYVLDQDLRPVPIGVEGEICVAGNGLAEGYWQQPELTARAFVPHPFSSDPSARLYRTGDLGRWLPDGRVAFIGRRDGQIKLRGHRIETGEIEATLRAHPQVREALVLLRTDRPEHPLLTAYLVASLPAPGIAELRQHLEATLPGYMIPDAFVPLSKWPVTVAGKIDRRALPSPEFAPAADHGEAPANDVERLLATLFAEVLSIDRIGRHDRFFQLGGNSLLALRAVTRIRQALRIELPVPVFFTHPTVAKLADALRQEETARVRIDQIAAARLKLATMTPAQKQALLQQRPTAPSA